MVLARFLKETSNKLTFVKISTFSTSFKSGSMAMSRVYGSALLHKTRMLRFKLEMGSVTTQVVKIECETSSPWLTSIKIHFFKKLVAWKFVKNRSSFQLSICAAKTTFYFKIGKCLFLQFNPLVFQASCTCGEVNEANYNQLAIISKFSTFQEALNEQLRKNVSWSTLAERDFTNFRRQHGFNQISQLAHNPIVSNMF